LFSFNILPRTLVEGLKENIKAEEIDNLGDIKLDELHLWKLHEPWPISFADQNINKLLEHFRRDNAWN
jgi:hypothetical protein